MVRFLESLCLIVLLGLLGPGCKKDAVLTIAPPPAVQVPINDQVETAPAVQQPVSLQVNGAIGGFYCALPALYAQTTKRYPLLIFLPGAGQFGNGKIDLPLLLNDGVPQVLDEKKFPPNFRVNGENFSFIVLSPQFSRFPFTTEVESFIEFAKKSYRVDTSRMYLSGLSMGGVLAADVGAEYTSHIAAIVPISGVSVDGDIQSKCASIAHGNLPVWVFHNSDDPRISAAGPLDFVKTIALNHPSVQPRITLFHASVHDAWTAATNPYYKENNMNMYEWLLQYKR